MKISILCSSKAHPINPWLAEWIEKNDCKHEISLIRKKAKLITGDILFLISCHELIQKKERDRFKYTLVIHASDLPNGRGWSPHIWEILNGADHITVSLLEAEDKVDSGRIWKKERIDIPKNYLYDEINEKLFDAELRLMTYAIENFETINPKNQPIESDYPCYRLRNPEDSRIDPEKTLIEQFNLLRICDPNRFPTFFELNGHTFTLKIEKTKKHDK